MSLDSRAVVAQVDGMKGSRRKVILNVVLIVLVLTLILIGGVTQPQLLSPDNLIAVVRSASLIGIAAVGMTFITLSGAFVSLSTEQTAVMAAIVSAMALGAGQSIWTAATMAIVVAIALGLIQGLFVALGLNTIITTLGAGAAIFGIANVITDSKTIQARLDEPLWIGTARPFGIPVQVWIFIILVILTTIVVKKTSFGRAVVLIGSNRATARSSGLNIPATILGVFVIASVFAAVVGILLVAQVEQAKVLNFQGFNIDVVAAVLVGGTAIQGGQGSTLRTALGAIAIALVTNYMLLAQFQEGVRLVVIGGVVALAVVAFHWVREKA